MTFSVALMRPWIPAPLRCGLKTSPPPFRFAILVRGRRGRPYAKFDSFAEQSRLMFDTELRLSIIVLFVSNQMFIACNRKTRRIPFVGYIFWLVSHMYCLWCPSKMTELTVHLLPKVFGVTRSHCTVKHVTKQTQMKTFKTTQRHCFVTMCLVGRCENRCFVTMSV